MTNSEYKYLRSLQIKKHRDEEGQFLVEGAHLIRDLISSKYYSKNLEKVYFSSGFEKPELIALVKDNKIPIDIIAAKEFEKLSETRTPQGILGVVNKTENVNTGYENAPLVIALENLNDPGNLGTIIRTAYWFGAGRIILGENSVDIFNSKVIRATQGALFNLQITENMKIEDELKILKDSEYEIYLTDLNASLSLDAIDKAISRNVFVFGNETHGISNSLLENANYKKIKIEPHSSCESLNVAVSAGIILYHFRQK